MKRKQKRRRRIKKEDRISSLPDDLRVDIISRLPSTEECISTGILSKRWKNTWTAVRNLIFINESEKPVPDFISYIENVLKKRGQLDLNKFQLDSYIPYGDDKIDDRLNNCIRYAFDCKVKDLDLVFESGVEPYKSDFVLDQFFFTNSSFTRMKLDGCVLRPDRAISWTNIKSLCILWGTLNEGLIKKILSGSPLLETLKLELCEGFGGIDITSKSVKNLVFSGYTDLWDVYMGYIATWADLRVVTLNAPNIVSLTIKGELALHKLVLLDVSSLLEAKLNYFKHPPYESTSGDKEEEMLKDHIQSLRHVKNLKIGHKCQKTLTNLEAKGFTFPSKMEHHDRPDYDKS